MKIKLSKSQWEGIIHDREEMKMKEILWQM